ncbi:MAG: family 16 glycosylhydrolase, partial [Bacteroidota bacterium]
MSKRVKWYWILGMLFLFPFREILAQNCTAGQIYTEETYLYGRFEVRMQSAAGAGIISSFFLYNLDVACNWPVEVNELDLEMTGNSTNLWFTTHYPFLTNITDIYDPGFNPHDGLQDYAFEWEPGIVRWFVNGQLVNIQDEAMVADLNFPMNIMMNTWAVDNSAWAGGFDPSILPVFSTYDYVKYYRYTPGSGTTGTNNNFTPEWEDDFNALDEDRWIISKDDGFGGNFCRFKEAATEFTNGTLLLKVQDPDPNPPVIPVTFSVNTSSLNLLPTDQIYLNGTFNSWCGTCEPMIKIGDTWWATVALEPGSYEYLFTKNLWEENGGAPLGSDCDYAPCDEYANYGVDVLINDQPITLETPCWASCDICQVTNIETPISDREKVWLKITDLL